MGLEVNIADMFPRELSSGIRKMVEFAREIAQNPLKTDSIVPSPTII
jgi:ABC-type transporter Mla maintaining outer membrane lipid asymmetry ATPase subunit MlaF